jgi:hypothetical protein
MKIERMLAAVAGGLIVAVTPVATAGAAEAPDRSLPQGTPVIYGKLTDTQSPNDVDSRRPYDVGAMGDRCADNFQGSYVCFVPDGDHFVLTDTVEDGYSAAVYFETDYGRTGVCVNPYGWSTTVDCNYNLREGAGFDFWAVNIDLPTNTYLYWSAVQTDIA